MTLTLNCTCRPSFAQKTFYFSSPSHPAVGAVSGYFFEGLQRSGMSKAHMIWMKCVGLWNRERPAGELLVLSDHSYAHELCVMRQKGRNCPFPPSKCLKSRQRNFGLFSPLYCQVLCRQSIFSFFTSSFFFFFHIDITHLYKPVLKISINCSLWG